MQPRITIPASIRETIFKMAMSGVPRKRVLAYVHDTATGQTTPNTEAGLEIYRFAYAIGSAHADEAKLAALLSYASNLRPNRSPQSERVRKQKYTLDGPTN